VGGRELAPSEFAPAKEVISSTRAAYLRQVDAGIRPVTPATPNLNGLTHIQHVPRAILLSPLLEIYKVTMTCKGASGLLNGQ
jgi:hypothetical protein